MAAGALGTCPSDEMRPAVGFRPTTPQNADGMRMLPAMSAPSPSGEPPAAISAPSPPELPPADRSRRHGFRVRPLMGLFVSIEPLMSEQLDLPSTMAPAAFMLRTASASCSAACSRSRSEPAVNRTSATASASLTVIGTPWSGGGIGGNPGLGQSPRRAPGRVERRSDQRVDVRLDLLDSRDVGIDDLQRARVPDPDSARQLRRSESCELVHRRTAESWRVPMRDASSTVTLPGWRPTPGRRRPGG